MSGYTNGKSFGERKNEGHHASLVTPTGTLQNVFDRVKACSDTTSEYTSEEDYDTLEHDPRTVVDGGKGGGFMPEVDANGVVRELSQHENRLLRAAPIDFQAEERVTEESEKKNLQVGPSISKETEDSQRRMSLERAKSRTPHRRGKFGDLVFTRRFTTFDRQNSDTADSAFHGFFTLFWLGTAIYVLKIAAENWRRYGSILGTNEIMELMFRRDVMVLGLADGVMCGVTGFGLLLQVVIYKDYISWNGAGWIIQSVWEVLFLVGVLEWTLFREWPWTHTIFFVLHGLVMLMKQHSYAFYNGHLAETYRTREILRRKLNDLKSMTRPRQGSGNRTRDTATTFSNHQPDLKHRHQASKHEPTQETVQDLQEVLTAIKSSSRLDDHQIETFEHEITWELDALTEELKGKCTTGHNFYPKNLSLKNHYEYIVLPTLVYELEYPRSEKINWYYVAEKGVAVFGILAIMNLVSQAFIYPVVVQTLEMKESGLPLRARLEVFPWILGDLIFPFMMEYLMTWYVIWECILNLLAEITYFADRGFYSDWWNSVSWDQFARDWNRPVHTFLLRHVYHSSISSMKVNKYTATLITFLLSACVHELVMWCLFKKLRGYLLFLQMMQIPLVQLSRSKWLAGRATLGNLFFWIAFLFVFKLVELWGCSGLFKSGGNERPHQDGPKRINPRDNAWKPAALYTLWLAWLAVVTHKGL